MITLDRVRELANDPQVALVGRVKKWLEDPTKIYPVSCTGIVVEDTYYDMLPHMDSRFETIAGSREFVTRALKGNAGVAVHLHKLRPKGTKNSKGLEAQGTPNFLQVFSAINEEVRRGNGFKNGAVLLYTDFSDPDLTEFLNYPKAKLPWAKRAVMVDESMLAPENAEKLQALADAADRGDIFITKITYDEHGERLYTQVCTTVESMVSTSTGLSTVGSLINKDFTAEVQGQQHNAVDTPIHTELGHEANVVPGFWSTGLNEVVDVRTQQGYSQIVTPSHRFQTTKGLVEARKLIPGDRLILDTENTAPWVGGDLNFEEGYIMGYFVANGNYSEGALQIKFWKDWPQGLVDELLIGFATLAGAVSKPLDNVEYTMLNTKKLQYIADRFGIYPGNKKLNPQSLAGLSYDALTGFLSGYIDGDGCVMVGKGNTRDSIQIASIELSNLKTIQQALVRLRIRSTLILNHQPAGRRTIKGQDWDCKVTHRLDITGLGYIDRVYEQLQLRKPDKAGNLESIYNNGKNRRPNRNYAVVSEVVPAGIRETYTCAIGSEDHLYTANGLVQANCVEIRFKSKSTCTLAHVNLGMVSNPAELPSAFNKNMEALIGIWSNIDHSDSPYLDQTKDKQVGLGVIGLANMLAHFGVPYRKLVREMKFLLKDVDDLGIEEGLSTYMSDWVDGVFDASNIAYYLAAAFIEAGKLAASYGLERAFTIAPTANCSRAYKDLNGYTCTPEISPPVAHPVTKIAERISNGVVEEYQYPPNVELAHYDVSFDTYYELACLWQRFMDLGGLAHAISFNVWSPGATITPEFLHKWFYGPLISLYYRWSVVVDAADKTSIQVEDAEEWSDFWGGEPGPSACGLVNPGDDKQGCSTCGD